jgi:hypothetical protein
MPLVLSGSVDSPVSVGAKLYDPVVGLSGVIAVDTTCDGCVVSRLGGAYFGVFFLGFFASRLRLSLFPMPLACHDSLSCG